MKIPSSLNYINQADFIDERIEGSMENELMKQDQMEHAIQTIQVVQGSVVFGSYQELKRQATELAGQIETVEVTEDNVKMSKKLLAEVNKRVKALEDKRISIKKEMLEPYQVFEEQVKEIVGIVKDADSLVRDQVKALEEQERLQKENEIREIWDKRINQYSFKDIVQFMDFAKPKHVTKTITIQAVEKEMVQFLEKVESDMKVIYQLPEVDNHINAYLNTFDLGQAMTIVKQEQERKAQIELARKKATKQTPEKIAYLVSINVHNQKELKLLEMILEEHQFEYTTEKVVL
jgi:hypothetical protein